MLYEKYLPYNTWTIEGGVLKLHYDNLKKEICTIYLIKNANNDCMTYLLENRIEVKLQYKDNQFLLSYVKPNRRINLERWEWIDIEK